MCSAEQINFKQQIAKTYLQTLRDAYMTYQSELLHSHKSPYWGGSYDCCE